MTNSSGNANSNANPSDPSGFLNPPQQILKIINTARGDLNGKFGTAVSFSLDRNRYTIALPPTNPVASSPQSQQPTVVSLKSDNLVKATIAEKMKFKAMAARQQAEMLYNDPHVRQQFQSAYNNMESRLPPNVKLLHVAYGLIALWVLSVYFFGFTRTMLALSFMAMPILISAPDLMSGNVDMKTVIRNFPSRWRAAIVEMTGYTKLTDRQGMAGFAVLCVLCFALLSSPSAPSKQSAVPASPPSSLASSGITTATTTAGSSTLSKFEEFYKLGFDDASSNHPFGHSLPSPETATTTSSPAYTMEEDLDWAYQPPPPPPRKNIASKFSFSTMMAAFTLFRTAKDLALDQDGRPNLQVFITNAKTLDPMRMGLLGLSLYRLIHVFLFQ